MNEKFCNKSQIKVESFTFLRVHILQYLFILNCHNLNNYWDTSYSSFVKKILLNRTKTAKWIHFRDKDVRNTHYIKNFFKSKLYRDKFPTEELKCAPPKNHAATTDFFLFLAATESIY